jgi:DNA adenine methylase
MVEHVCDKCEKVFKQKSQLDAHNKRKTPCKKNDTIEKIVEKKVVELLDTLVPDICVPTFPAPSSPLPPLIKWSGGKSDEISQILPYIPEFKTYVEPFVGGGSLYFHLAPQTAIINDVHPDLIALYRTVAAGQQLDIKTFMDANPNDETTYYRIRAMKPTTDLERACQFYYLRKTCYRGMLRYNKSGEFNIPFGRYASINYSSLDDTKYHDLLSRTTIMNGSFKEVFERCNDPSNFIFLDPPYDSTFTDYGYCSFGRDEHQELFEAFKNSRSKCLMIIGKTEFISDLYKDYIVGEYNKKYRFKLHSGRIGNEIDTIHLVIRNY